MTRKKAELRFILIGFISITVLITGGCTIFQYRDIQSNFERAVRIDNGESVSPFTEDNSSEAYQSIIDGLSEDRIADLDDRLKANAWLLRSYSAWRIGDLNDARQSASKGLNQGSPGAHSRDKVLLVLIPALLAESETMSYWAAANQKTSPQDYKETHEKSFELVWDKILAAQLEIGDPTPESVGYYVKYQKWRILQNWRQVIDSFPSGRDDDRRAAKDRARNKVGADLNVAAKQARDKIPENHTLRKLIEAKGG